MSGAGAAARVSILGVEVSRRDLGAAVEEIQRLVAGGGRHQVVVLPVNCVMSARKDRGLKAIYNGASLAVADGVPLVWASRFLGRPIPGRVAGSDLLAEMSKAAAQTGLTFYFLGSRPEVLQKLVRVLRRENPGLKVVGSCSPPFHSSFPPEVNREMIEGINAARPDLLWVGLGAPKQDRWIHDNLPALEVKVAVGVGAAFDICSRRVRRAPLWMQRSSLEWFFRFLLEPRRLFKRYFIEAAPFIPLVVAQKLCRRPGKASSSG